MALKGAFEFHIPVNLFDIKLDVPPRCEAKVVLAFIAVAELQVQDRRVVVTLGLYDGVLELETRLNVFRVQIGQQAHHVGTIGHPDLVCRID